MKTAVAASPLPSRPLRVLALEDGIRSFLSTWDTVRNGFSWLPDDYMDIADVLDHLRSLVGMPDPDEPE